MSDASLSIMPILAIPLGIMPLPEMELLNPVISALFNERMRKESAAQRSPLCYHGSDDLFDWPDEPVRQLAAAIFRGLYAVVYAVNDFTETQLRALKSESSAWFTVIEHDGGVPATNYPLTTWCAIYCVEAPGPSPTRSDSGVLRFYESRPNTMFTDASNAAMRLPFTPGHHAWRPTPGNLAIFPASLTHEIAPVRSPGQLVLVTVRVRFVGPAQGLAR